jgi:hypothetical protein
VFLVDVDKTLLDKVLATYPPADINIDRIGELLEYDLAPLLEAGRSSHGNYER